MLSASEEWPFAYVVSEPFSSSLCHYCLNSSDQLLHCAKCQFARYCDNKCQQSAWADHKFECIRLKLVSPKIPPETARLMARIIWKLYEQSGPELSTEACTVDGRTFKHLISHEEDIRADSSRMDHIGVLFRVITEYIGHEPEISVRRLIELYGKVVINSFSITNDDLNGIGTGLYLNFSVMNHSCRPECCLVFRGPKAILRSLNGKNIVDVPLEHLTISYIDVLATTLERQKQLKNQYYFTCHCLACQDSEQDSLKTGLECPNKTCGGVLILSGDVGHCSACSAKFEDCSENMQKNLKLMNSIKCEIHQMDRLFNAEQFLFLYEKGKTLESRLKSCSLHRCNIYRIKLMDKLFDACLELQKFDEANKYLAETLDAYQRFYPANHPAVGLQLLKFGKLNLYLDNSSKAYEALAKAEKILKNIYETECPFYKTIQQLLAQCKVERVIKNDQRNQLEYYH